MRSTEPKGETLDAPMAALSVNEPHDPTPTTRQEETANSGADELYSRHEGTAAENTEDNANNTNNDDGDDEGEEGDDAKDYPPCAQCGRPVKSKTAPRTINGPLHAGCVMEYRFLHQPRCHYCDIRFTESEAMAFVKDPETGFLYHDECAQKERAGVPFTKPTLEGYVRKQAVARSKLSPKNWKVRYFVLSPEHGGIRYYEADPTGKNKPPRDTGKSGKESQQNAEENNNSDDDDDNDGAESSTSSTSSTTSSEDEAQRKAKAAKLAKGHVVLDRRTRLITNPSLSLYKGSTSAADSTPAHSELAIIFYDSPESKKERRLLFQCKDPKERYVWMRALEAYIHTVDDPSDYKRKAEKASEDKK